MHLPRTSHHPRPLPQSPEASFVLRLSRETGWCSQVRLIQRGPEAAVVVLTAAAVVVFAAVADFGFLDLRADHLAGQSGTYQE